MVIDVKHVKLMLGKNFLCLFVRLPLVNETSDVFIIMTAMATYALFEHVQHNLDQGAKWAGTHRYGVPALLHLVLSVLHLFQDSKSASPHRSLAYLHFFFKNNVTEYGRFRNVTKASHSLLMFRCVQMRFEAFATFINKKCIIVLCASFACSTLCFPCVPTWVVLGTFFAAHL